MVVYLLHMIGAVAMGFYLLLPLVVGKLDSLSAPAQEGAVSTVRTLNRFAQYALIIQLLTGGYMLMGGDYSLAWMIIVILLLLIIAALGGMMGKPLRLAIEGLSKGNDISAQKAKLRTFSALLAISVLLMLFFMVYNGIV
ncbi:hypothetical protein OIN60_13945 [Paenibacillus sp. P96]|uniref:DUF2269 family protein n=1 Tax=Paenibacillus zeirhizosphaerae TaxID=2987519 RepID=A0ABT9FT20_9BACL|nr:hypothetical protein [Paenibacillus sp. P96]MDP4097873.1 hypothetical protein [Paenibacillus sp. P96]